MKSKSHFIEKKLIGEGKARNQDSGKKECCISWLAQNGSRSNREEWIDRSSGLILRATLII